MSIRSSHKNILSTAARKYWLLMPSTLTEWWPLWHWSYPWSLLFHVSVSAKKGSGQNPPSLEGTKHTKTNTNAELNNELKIEGVELTIIPANN